MSGLALFDLDNTLVDRSDAFRRWAVDFADAHDAENDRDVAVAWLVERDGDGYVSRTDFWTAVREHYGLAAPVPDLVAQYTVRYPGYVTVEPGVKDAVTRLRVAGWRIAVVTNGRDEAQRAKVTRSGLDAHVDATIVSEGIGIAKPDPRIFALAAETVGASLKGGWMVGDHAENDIVGGAEVGLRTVWIRRGRDWPDGLTLPDMIVDDIPAAVDHILAE